ncbi:hypothetical protein NLI96_g7694 [Meripilus lineatus]|uniref:Poly [ADP-ribose] polymerase n=1 Tax=Meripilus lineatus TaxID=2056292 RepID=A0AAD5UYW8_9APHY|nr:hypothetical protein NLI96_g7694 [Physisporinus lineatus]
MGGLGIPPYSHIKCPMSRSRGADQSPDVVLQKIAPEQRGRANLSHLKPSASYHSSPPTFWFYFLLLILEFSMPPRKKAAAAATADADATTPAAPTRASTRNRAPSSKAAAVAAVATASTSNAPATNTTAPASKAKASASKAKAPASKAKAPASKAKATGKGKGKRARDEEEEEEAKDDEPDTKKAKADDTKDGDANGKDNDVKMDDADEEEEEKKMVTVIKRGAAPVDPCSGRVDTHQVFANNEGVWDAMLNQTDVGKNANKFYVIQLLHPIGNDATSTLFTRWGRVGENGQQQSKGPFPASHAIAEFKKQFKAKSGTDWEKRHGMVAKKGKYTWLERDFEDEEEKKDDTKKAGSSGDKEPEKIPDCTLDPEIKSLCNLIFSTKLMDATLSSMNYDANKLPLGKLAKSTILNGFAALKLLSEVIQDPNGDTSKEYGGFRSAVDTLTGRYYSIIPHVFGRNRPTIIDDMNTLKRELELVDALGDMEVASKLISSTVLTDSVTGLPINPLDAQFKSLHLSKMDVVNPKTAEFKALERYTQDTHGATHSHYKVKVENAFRVERQDETDAWLKAGNDSLGEGERLLLWHGSRTTNFAGILKQGLRIAPPEAPVTGYMFGKGVYFADMMSKSANYCHAYLSDNTGLLLLCEIAAKPFFEQKDANYHADRACKEANAMCTKGLGRTQPGEWQDAGDTLSHPELKGCHMPKGKGENVDEAGLWLQYNEYIVYDVSQIRLRYLLMVNMG